MDVSAREKEENSTFTVLVTGANSGLGFALCCRLIDEFLYTRPQSQTLHLLYSTRDTRKGDDTQKRLQAHLQRTLREANGKTLGISLLLEARVKIEGVLVDLLKLTTVKTLAEQLLRRGQRIDAVVCNAGVAGWLGINWPKAIWTVCTDLVQAVTYPTYMNCDVGARAKTQVQKTTTDVDEPVLGEVFTANVFGHYLLVHWLGPLMNDTSRVIWISSTGAVADTFRADDIQGLKSLAAYESSKRLTDILVLTSELPATKPYTTSYFSSTTQKDTRPKMLVTHPGVVATSISGLHWFLSFFMTAALYFARVLGSPWHAIEPYKGAVSMAFAVLAPQLMEQESREGKGKWGSATSVQGDERVARTEVEGWGYCGKPGVIPPGSATNGLYRERKETTRESREEFEELGRGVWKEMEEMRNVWERRLGPLDQA
ncbi:Putative NAD(P)-binding domain superfamily [Septoria linicola]|uniref:NAD(P)-binding domain superfamily n=1 Tax=Septoria linicola TaxID=215465 RepID=A0A9Q9APF4_9PEZI|nr:Putative NAD(P)-binding domain superfamily [Septoria linicola]